jgi:transposase
MRVILVIQEKSWEITDEFWERVKDILIRPKRKTDRTYKRKPGGGRKPMDLRLALAGVFYILRTGVQWKALPKEYGASSSVHRYFMLWTENGIFHEMWRRGLTEYDETKGIVWEWQSIDGSMVKAPLALEAVGSNPTDRGKKWEQKACAGRW